MDNVDDVLPVAPAPSTPTKSSQKNLTPAPGSSDDSMRGFTLSYLRRVLDLSLMEERVVNAEANRRVHDARKKAKEDARKNGGSGQELVAVANIICDDQKKRHPRKKRLFKTAIAQLVKNEDVIPWKGVVRPCARRPWPDTSQLWASSTRQQHNIIVCGLH